MQVHRSVQILRDKQELAETQKELAKLQLVQKDSSSSNHSQCNEERPSPAASDVKRNENASDMKNQQLALALPHQVAPQQQPVAPPPQPPTQNVTHQQSYYMPATQLPTPPAPAPCQQPQGQYLSSDPQYRTPQTQMPDPSRMASQPTQSQPNQVPPGHQFPPQYPQQWPQPLPQQLPQQVQQAHQPSMQPQMRPSSPAVYQAYPPSQPTNPPPPEMLPNSAAMQVPYSAVPQTVSSRADATPYGYGAPGRTVPQQAPPPPQPIKGNYGAQPGDTYAAAGSLPTLPPASAYMMYDSESGRSRLPTQQSQFAQGGYPPPNPVPSQFVRSHPHSDLIEKLVSMGFRGDHAAGVIQRMEESGQPVDFNAVIDRLSGHSSGGSSQRSWSG